jgi:hypothetical protein
MKNEIILEQILNNKENRTTVMIRNIPNKLKKITLLELIN